MKNITICMMMMMLIGCQAQQVTKTSDLVQASSQPAAAISGQCHCGAVKYEAAPPIIKSSYCDCRGCQRTTGTLKAPFITVSQRSFKIVSGEVATFRATNGQHCDAEGAWKFCPKCGSPLYWMPNRGDTVDIFAGNLDNPKLFTLK